jgi:hypothetical protein
MFKSGIVIYVQCERGEHRIRLWKAGVAESHDRTGGGLDPRREVEKRVQTKVWRGGIAGDGIQFERNREEKTSDPCDMTNMQVYFCGYSR